MTTVPATKGIRTDGRTARSARTRDAVVESFLALIDEGHLRPTAKQVSERAGVSLRSVFQHFADLESLFAAAADRQVERLQALAVRIPADAPFEERLRLFIDARARLLERITPVRRAALLHEPFSAEIARRLKWARELKRDEDEHVFALELRDLPASERREVLQALNAATAWACWETLRAHHTLSENDAKKVIGRTIRALLNKEA